MPPALPAPCCTEHTIRRNLSFIAHVDTSGLLHMLAGIMQVLTHHTTKKLLETKNLPPAAAGMTDIDAVQWGVAQLRHCLSHEVGSRTTQLVSRA